MLEVLTSPDFCPAAMFDDIAFFEEFKKEFSRSLGSDGYICSLGSDGDRDVKSLLPHGAEMHKVYFLLVEKAGPKLKDDPDFLRKMFLNVCRTSYAFDYADKSNRNTR